MRTTMIQTKTLKRLALLTLSTFFIGIIVSIVLSVQKGAGNDAEGTTALILAYAYIPFYLMIFAFLIVVLVSALRSIRRHQGQGRDMMILLAILIAALIIFYGYSTLLKPFLAIPNLHQPETVRIDDVTLKIEHHSTGFKTRYFIDGSDASGEVHSFMINKSSYEDYKASEGRSFSVTYWKPIDVVKQIDPE